MPSNTGTPPTYLLEHSDAETRRQSDPSVLPTPAARQVLDGARLGTHAVVIGT
jgi:hypothetical protein